MVLRLFVVVGRWCWLSLFVFVDCCVFVVGCVLLFVACSSLIVL